MNNSHIATLLEESVLFIRKNATRSPESVVGLEYWNAFDFYTTSRVRLIVALFINMWNDAIPFHYFLYTLLYRIIAFPIQIIVRHIQMPFWIGWCAWKNRGKYGIGWVCYITFKRVVTHPVILLSNLFPPPSTDPYCEMHRMILNENIRNPFKLYNRLKSQYPTESRRLLFDMIAYWTLFEQVFDAIENRLWK